MSTHESPKDAALRLMPKGFEFEALYDWDGFWNIRLISLESQKKEFRAMHITDQRKYALRLPKFSSGKPLYRRQRIISCPNEIIFICEGEKCVDALEALGFVATTSGAASSANSADWQLLTGRSVIIWPDNDKPGRKYAMTVAEKLKLLECHIKIIDIDKLKLPDKGDFVDWLEVNSNATREDVMNLPYIEEEIAEKSDNLQASQFESERQSQASALVLFVKERVELFHDKNSAVYGRDLSTFEIRRLDGRQFEHWLVANFHEHTKQSVRDQSLREALSTLSGLARHKGECHDVQIRVAQQGNVYFLDLGEPGRSRAIRITPGKWEIINNPPVRFLRPETLRALPEPVQCNDLSTLWDIINVSEKDHFLVIAWLIECLRPDTPFPVLEIIGEQGSAKSTTQTMLRRLIDPNACDLRAAPKTIEDIFVSAGVNWMVSYENISHLSPQMQDALCVIATGGGFAKRKSYTDADESVIIIKRPVVLNGISVAVTAQDLIDRTISIEAPLISRRIEITDLWKKYEIEHPKFLGAILNFFSQALTILPTIQLPDANRPRLIEFVHLGMAIAEVMSRSGDKFLNQFNAGRQESIARTIDASPVAVALIEWFEQNQKRTTELPIKQLFEKVESFKPHNMDNWPRSAKGFADALRRMAPALRQMGIECRSVGKKGSFIWWRIQACDN